MAGKQTRPFNTHVLLSPGEVARTEVAYRPRRKDAECFVIKTRDKIARYMVARKPKDPKLAKDGHLEVIPAFYWLDQAIRVARECNYVPDPQRAKKAAERAAAQSHASVKARGFDLNEIVLRTSLNNGVQSDLWRIVGGSKRYARVVAAFSVRKSRIDGKVRRVRWALIEKVDIVDLGTAAMMLKELASEEARRRSGSRSG